MTRFTPADLHYPDGTHRATGPTADGHELDIWERAAGRHRAAHASAPCEWCGRQDGTVYRAAPGDDAVCAGCRQRETAQPDRGPATTRYKCPTCGGSNTYGGDPYPCDQCGYDGRTIYEPETARTRPTTAHERLTAAASALAHASMIATVDPDRSAELATAATRWLADAGTTTRSTP
jgi:hypothetical protein